MDTSYFGSRFPCMETGTDHTAGAGTYEGGFPASVSGVPSGPGYGAFLEMPEWSARYPDGAHSVCPPGTIPYTARAGDTTPGLADVFGVSEYELARLNPCVTEERLFPGQTVCIPAGEPVGGSRTIGPGETLEGKAGGYDMAVEDPYAANPLLNPLYDQPGDMPRVPDAGPPDVMTYTVGEGDTLGGICIKCNTSVEILLYGNPGFDPLAPKTGTRLRICPISCEPRCGASRLREIPQGMDLVSCARALGVDPDELLLANSHLAPCRFTGGCGICLPDA